MELKNSQTYSDTRKNDDDGDDDNNHIRKQERGKEGKLSFIEKFWLIIVEDMIEWENHHFIDISPKVMINSGKGHQRMLKHFDEPFLRN